MQTNATPRNGATGAAHHPSTHHRAGTYQKALDGRKRPIRGLWQRNGKFYARISVEDPGTGRKQVRRVPLAAATAAQAQTELRRLLTKREENALPILKLTPKFKEYATQYLAYYWRAVLSYFDPFGNKSIPDWQLLPMLHYEYARCHSPVIEAVKLLRKAGTGDASKSSPAPRIAQELAFDYSEFPDKPWIRLDQKQRSKRLNKIGITEKSYGVSGDHYLRSGKNFKVYDPKTGFNAYGGKGYLKYFSHSLPALLHGTNGRLIKNQAELDTALEILRQKAAELGDPQPKGRHSFNTQES